MGAPEVLAVVPARNEAASVADTVRALRSIASVGKVVVVDDGSEDATASEAARAGADVVRSPVTLGKGRAMERGAAAAPADVIVFADADLGHTAVGMQEVLAPVLAGDADLAIATLPAQGGGFGIVKRMSRRLIRTAGGPTMAEPLSGQRAISASALASVRPLAAGFGVEVAMTIDAARCGLRIREVPTQLRHRPLGRTAAGARHRARQGIDILRAGLPRVLRSRGSGGRGR